MIVKIFTLSDTAIATPSSLPDPDVDIPRDT